MDTALVEKPEAANRVDAFKSGMPGVYSGVPAADYFALDAVSSSVLKVMHNESPLHCRHYMQHGIDASDEMDIGSAAHCLLFTPIEFDSLYITAPKCCATTGKGDACRYDAIGALDNQWLCGVHGKGKSLAMPGGMTVLSGESMQRTRGICDAVRRDKYARRVIDAATDFELTVVWLDEATGLLMKARLDILCRDKRIMPDLKTCRSLRTFNDDAFRRGYQIQMAHYQTAAKQFGLPAESIAVIAVENDAPHDVATPELDPDLLALGYVQRAVAIQKLAECRSSGEWPGLSDALQMMTVPRWARYGTI